MDDEVEREREEKALFYPRGLFEVPGNYFLLINID